MFDFIRTHQRLMQLVLLVLILPSFALIGISGYTNYVSGDDALATVGESSITQQEFDRARTNQLQQMQQINRGFDPAVLDSYEARKALLDALIDNRVVFDVANEQRFSVSDNVLRQRIASMPELQVDGQFSAERYNEVLASVGLESRDFERGQRSELALQRVLGPVSATAMPPQTVMNYLRGALTAERTVRLMAFPSSDFEKQVVVSDEDIKAWYEKNKQQLQLPDQVSVDYILLNEAAAMKAVPEVTEAQMKEYYEQNKSRYVLPARVQLSHILVNVAPGATQEQRDQAKAQAEKIHEKVVANPNAFADIARSDSQDAGTARDGGKLGWITKGSWPAALEQSVFTLKKGDISGVVDGPGGLHIFRADEVQSERGESFEQAKSKVETEIRRQLGADRFADMASRLTGLVYDNPSSLQPAADALGLPVKTASGVTSERVLPADQAVGDNPASESPDSAVLDDARVRRALFSVQTLKEKQNSGVIEISPDTMVVVRVNTLTPAHVPAVDQVTEQIREALVAERALAAAKKAGQEALAEFKAASAGEAPEGFGSPLTVSRINTQGLDKPVLDAAFDAPVDKLPGYVGVEGAQGYAIVRVEGAAPGKDDGILALSLPLQLGQLWGRAEEQAVMTSLREQAGVKILPEAEEALSADTEGK